MLILSPRRELNEFRKRYKWMALFAFAVFAILLVRMAQLQLVHHDQYQQAARENITKTVVLPATRGVLYDTNGRILATNRPSYNVFVAPQLLHVPEDVDRLAELMHLSEAEKQRVIDTIQAIPARRRTHQALLFRDIAREQLGALETHADELRAIDVVAVPVREYPFGVIAAHTIGYLNEVNADDLKRLTGRGYRAGDVIGRTGIEKSYEMDLRGLHGFRKVLVDARGRLQDGLTTPVPRLLVTKKEPQPGKNITLTLDTELMKNIERLFRGHPSGAAVVVEVNTGKVRALYSKPSYNLNEMSGKLTAARDREFKEDPFRPLIDKTIYESYFPGSIVKPFSAIAGLESHAIDAMTHVDCGGFYDLGRRRFRCTQAHGDVDLRKALARSCNVFFYRLAEQVGLDQLAYYARELGLGSPTGIGINTETSGFIPTREWYLRRYGDRFRVGFTLNAAIGQGNTKTSLLQIAMAYAAIANGGTLYTPQLIENMHDAYGKTSAEFHPKVRRKIRVSPEHLNYIVGGLFDAVNHPEGTAHEGYIPDSVSMAGKTGTAQVSQRTLGKNEDPKRFWYLNRDHAWFAGFGPSEHPEVAVVILVEHGGAGGKAAAPIGIQVLNDYLTSRQMPPLAATTTTAVNAESHP